MARISGIYSWENQVNKKKYIGQSVDIWDRWSSHRMGLNRNKSGCTALQYAWNKYGEDNFVFYVIEECTIDELDDSEAFWMKFLQSDIHEWGYNICGGGKSNRVFPEEMRKKMSDAKIGKTTWNKGIPMKEETKQKMIDAKIGYKNPNSKSKYRYVTYDKHRPTRPWRASVRIGIQEFEYLGYYETQEEAAEAYNKRAKELFGDDAILNIIEYPAEYYQIDTIDNVYDLQQIGVI